MLHKWPTQGLAYPFLFWSRSETGQVWDTSVLYSNPLCCSFSELSPSLNLTYTTKPVWKHEIKGIGQGRLPDNWTYTCNQWFICILGSWWSNSEQVLCHWAIEKDRWSLGGGSNQSASLKMCGKDWGRLEREWYGQSSRHRHRSLGPFSHFLLGPRDFQARLRDNKEQGTMTLSDFPGLLQGHSQNCSFGVPILSEQFSVPVLLNVGPDLQAVGVAM